METESNRYSREALEPDCEVEFFKATGPGGQHRNKRETGVRLLHKPTQIVVTATERRSQAQNLENAYERLAEKLRIRDTPKKKRKSTKPSRGAKEKRLVEKKKLSEKKAGRLPVEMQK
ncbi:MAG: peptide chain release factor-like protein [Candidatus Lernaella stagnicola]|nr:peptide chain release factor-like protein [Candidatus Lernaella stagnicola]